MKKELLIALSLITCFTVSCSEEKKQNAKIDRLALVTRHNVVLKQADTLGSLSVGNGEFAFTVDVSGLQTFPEVYENGIPLGTQSQWAWHRIPGAQKYTLQDVARDFESCDGTKAPYPVQHNEGRPGEATQDLRMSPHRLHLGIIGLVMLKENGDTVQITDLKNISQKLDLWTGKIESTYEVENTPVRVLLYAHQREDRIAARIESPLITRQRLKVRMKFPYGKNCHTCPGYDWENSDKHSTVLNKQSDRAATVTCTLDTTVYFTNVQWTKGTITESKKHHIELIPSDQKEVFEFTVHFTKNQTSTTSTFKDTEQNSVDQWKKFWTTGGAIDFSECTDPRAKELERRVVLSQYLTRIQCAGSLPPQETGLTMNSWFGKYHMEMHWWHGAHYPVWGRPELLEKSMQWYFDVMPKAKATAQWQGYTGARWQKMTDPYGNESPSNIGAFIIWQQPHPVFLAELLYRQDSSKAVLQKYSNLVSETAEFLVSFLKLKGDTYHLCRPLIPAQEIFKATETDDPAYELQYWYYAINVAQQWRERSGVERNKKWDEVLARLAPLAMKDNFYLPTATSPTAYTDDHFRTDHPAVLGAYGFVPYNERMDTAIMANTFKEITSRWKWETTWGWDYPLLAMTAARLNKPEQAINMLLMDVQKNTYLINGHNYQDERLRLYLPGNGGLLSAIALMAAGWDGNEKCNPGFPDNGKWKVKWEGLSKMP